MSAVLRLAAAVVAAFLVMPPAAAILRPGPQPELPVPAPPFVHQANAFSYDREGFFGQDAIIDDNGADSGGDVYSLLTGFEGDAYTTGEQTGVGDIRSVRVRPVRGSRDAVVVEVTMNSRQVTTRGPLHPRSPAGAGTVVEPHHQVAFVGVDDGPGGFEAWPHGALLSTPGIDRGYTLTFDGFATVSTGGDPAAVDANAAGHTMSVTVSGLRSRTIRMVVGAGEWDPAASRWKPQPGSPNPVLDLALSCPIELRPEITKPTRDDSACEWAQSTDLGAARTERSFFEVDLDRLGRVAPAPAPREGFVSYVFRSLVDNGDGYWRLTGNPQFLGSTQAFTVGLPRGWERRRSQLVVYLHGGAAWGTLQTPVDRWSSAIVDSGRVVLLPYGRGPAPWWYPAGEADVFEAISATESLFGTDPERRVLTGISHGGYGTYLLGFGHPDLWAGLVVYMAASDSRYAQVQSDPDLPYIDTARIARAGVNTPILMLAGTEQTLHEMEQRRELLASAGVEHTYKLFAEPVHGVAFPADVAGHVVDWLDDLGPRRAKPREIRLVTIPAWHEEPEEHPYRDGDGIVRRGRAWWIEAVRARAGVEEAAVAATDERVPQPALAPFGPEPGGTAGLPPLLATSGVRPTTIAAGAPDGEVRISLAGVQSLRLDLARLRLARRTRVVVTSDGPAKLVTSGGRLCRSSVCSISPGRNEFRVVAAPAPPPRPRPDPDLPATGTGSDVLVAVLLLAAAAWLGRALASERG